MCMLFLVICSWDNLNILQITDEATISAAKAIVLKRRAREEKNAEERDKTRAFDSRLQRVEERLDEILELLKKKA